ncbi:MAG: serine/threonine-protein kinase [Planctomycetota bacterium]|jgi:hypothetical protein
MASGNEILFGRIAVHNGLLSMDQLDECLGLQRARAPSKHVGQIMIERGLIDDVQARAILAAQRRRLHRDSHPERASREAELADLLLADGTVDRETLERARKAQGAMRERGLGPSLGDILVQQGSLGLGRLGEAMARIGRKALRCSSCGKKYRAFGYHAGIDARCRKCGGKLEPRDEPPPPRPGGLDLTVAVPPPQPFAEDADSFEVELSKSVRKRKPGRPPPRLRVGDVLGPCRLDEKIGGGGMGMVYRARHIALDRDVALKILATRHTTQPHYVQRFLTEARAAACLSHPNIMAVHDVGEDRGVYYMVMELVRGKSLDRILVERKRLDVKETMRIARQAADALDYAHGCGIVHRDIKTGNMMVGESGRVTIVDFGLTKTIGGEAHLTTVGAVMGTPHYMSPEQAEGSEVDGRSDLYSLGVTLFEMLTGQLPFEGGTNWDVLLRLRKEPPPDPSLIRPDIPEPVAKLVLRLLAKAPEERPRAGADVVNAIDALLEGLPD